MSDYIDCDILIFVTEDTWRKKSHFLCGFNSKFPTDKISEQKNTEASSAKINSVISVAHPCQTSGWVSLWGASQST